MSYRILLLKSVFMCLKGRVRQRGETVPLSWFTPQRLPAARSGSDQTQPSEAHPHHPPAGKGQLHLQGPGAEATQPGAESVLQCEMLAIQATV